jgi:thymidine kinase
VEIFKPEIDKRYDDINVVSHNENSIRSIPIQNASQLLLYIDGMDVVGIDEAQFLDDDLPKVCNYIANQGIRVIVAGLDMDFQGKPFGPIPALMATAEYVTKVHAICMKCGDLAHYSHRTIDNDKLVLLGETESYEPLCRKCYTDTKTGFKD